MPVCSIEWHMKLLIIKISNEKTSGSRFLINKDIVSLTQPSIEDCFVKLIQNNSARSSYIDSSNKGD